MICSLCSVFVTNKCLLTYSWILQVPSSVIITAPPPRPPFYYLCVGFQTTLEGKVICEDQMQRYFSVNANETF